MNGLEQNTMVWYHIMNVLSWWVLDLEIYLQTMKDTLVERFFPTFITRENYVHYSTTSYSYVMLFVKGGISLYIETWNVLLL